MKRWHVLVFILVMYGIGVMTGMAAKTEKPKPVTPTEIIDAYERGKKDALKTNPVSWDLEMTCAGLWVSKLPVQ